MKRKRLRRMTIRFLFAGMLVIGAIPAHAAQPELPQGEISYRLKVNGVVWKTESPPVLKNKLLLAPVADLFDTLGLHYYKHPASNRIEGNSYSNQVVLDIGSNIFAINGKAHKLAQPVEVVNGIVMMPVRSFYEVLGAKVHAIPGSREVEVKTSQSLEEKLRYMVDDYVKDRDFRGTILVMKNDRALFQDSFGMADESKNLANTIETQYRVASLTKPFTAAAIAKLEEEGKLRLEDRMSQYFPEQSLWKEIRIKHLLAHSSGLSDQSDLLIADFAAETGRTLSRPQFEAIFAKAWTPQEQIERIKDIPLAFSPGEKEDYGNSNYLLLGRIIEMVSGMSYQKYIEENLLKPAGMEDTVFHPSDAQRLAAGHSENRQTIHEPEATQYSYGSLISTVKDLYAFDEALRKGVLLKRETVDRILKPIMGSYGYAWNHTPVLGTKAYAHNGDLLGYHARMLRLVEQDATIIILSNNQLDLYSLIQSVLTGELGGAMEYVDQRGAMGYAEDLSAEIAAVLVSEEETRD